MSLPLDRRDLALLDGERQLAVLERQRFFAEHFAAPAGERGYVRPIIGGDALEVVDRGDHLGGDMVAFGDHAQAAP